MRSKTSTLLLAASLAALSFANAEEPPAWNSLNPEPGEWITWGGDLGNSRYAPLEQINRDNAGELRPVWRWKAEDILGRPDTNWKATPLHVDGVLYLPTGGSKVAALDPATFGYQWNDQWVTHTDSEVGPLVTLPEYYRLAKDGLGDAITSLGRFTLWKGSEVCRELGYEVIYGDTDSVFIQLADPSEDVTKADLLGLSALRSRLSAHAR